MLGSVYKGDPRQTVIELNLKVLIFLQFLDCSVVSDRLDLRGICLERVTNLKEQKRILDWIDYLETDSKPAPFAIEHITFDLGQS